MAGTFDAKYFNAEVFQKYIDRIPNPRKTELLKSRPEITAVFACIFIFRRPES